MFCLDCFQSGIASRSITLPQGWMYPFDFFTANNEEIECETNANGFNNVYVHKDFDTSVCRQNAIRPPRRNVHCGCTISK